MLRFHLEVKMEVRFFHIKCLGILVLELKIFTGKVGLRIFEISSEGFCSFVFEQQMLDVLLTNVLTGDTKRLVPRKARP